MNQARSIAHLGRQPRISAAEIESLLGSESIVAIHDDIAVLSVDTASVPGKRLGGTTKLTEIVAEADTGDWLKIKQSLLEYMKLKDRELEDGKITLGLSVYGLKVRPKDIEKSLLSIKKALKHTGRSVRAVTSRASTLSTAQVLHNGMTKPKKMELNVVRAADTTYITQTTWVQDIDAYTKRDQARPARDAKVGMLPPKLAQILVNLAAGNTDPRDRTLLDPFCGTGVLLQEAQLMGFNLIGTDIEPRMIDYTRANLKWLHDTHNFLPSHQVLDVGDATKTQWPQNVSLVACETYLGPPLAKPATKDQLAQIVPKIDLLHKQFLQNLGVQIKPGTRLCLAVPAWAKKGGGFEHLPTLDSLKKLGYNRLDFAHSSRQDLVYHRDGQAVARELIVLVKE